MFAGKAVHVSRQKFSVPDMNIDVPLAHPRAPVAVDTTFLRPLSRDELV